MPTLLLIKGFRFFFYSNENNEPMHVHVTKGDAYGKIWLEPSIIMVYLIGFNKSEIKEINEIIIAHLEQFKKKWHEYFNK